MAPGSLIRAERGSRTRPARSRPGPVCEGRLAHNVAAPCPRENTRLFPGRKRRRRRHSNPHSGGRAANGAVPARLPQGESRVVSLRRPGSVRDQRVRSSLRSCFSRYCCFRSCSTTSRSNRWCPPSVTRQASRPSRAHRVTVFGDTPSSFETSDRVRNSVPLMSVSGSCTAFFTEADYLVVLAWINGSDVSVCSLSGSLSPNRLIDGGLAGKWKRLPSPGWRASPDHMGVGRVEPRTRSHTDRRPWPAGGVTSV